MIRFKIDEVTVSFPYPYVYPEQLEYMTELKRLLDQDGHGILEMPTGTGKTVCLLSLCLSYIKSQKPNFKLVYCTRTIVEMQKTLEELKFVMDAREKDFCDDDERHLNSSILALCLSSRKNMCIHPDISQEEDRSKVDSMCRELVSPWAREKEGNKGCSYFEQFQEK